MKPKAWIEGQALEGQRRPCDHPRPRRAHEAARGRAQRVAGSVGSCRRLASRRLGSPRLPRVSGRPVCPHEPVTGRQFGANPIASSRPHGETLRPRPSTTGVRPMVPRQIAGTIRNAAPGQVL
jgi:hypothetical protein